MQQLVNNPKSLLISYVRFDCEGDTMPRRDSATSGRFRCPRDRVRDVVTR